MQFILFFLLIVQIQLSVYFNLIINFSSLQI